MTVDNSVSVGVEEEDVEEQYDPDLGELMGVAWGGGDLKERLQHQIFLCEGCRVSMQCRT